MEMNGSTNGSLWNQGWKHASFNGYKNSVEPSDTQDFWNEYPEYLWLATVQKNEGKLWGDPCTTPLKTKNVPKIDGWKMKFPF